MSFRPPPAFVAAFQATSRIRAMDRPMPKKPTRPHASPPQNEPDATPPAPPALRVMNADEPAAHRDAAENRREDITQATQIDQLVSARLPRDLRPRPRLVRSDF